MSDESFEEFKKHVSFDVIDDDESGQSTVLAIFSIGYSKEYSKEFVKDYPDLVKDLTAYDLYGIVSKIST